MNIFLFCLCYVITMIGVGTLVFLKCALPLQYIFIIYILFGLLGIGFLYLSCNPFFYESVYECNNRPFLVYYFNYDY